jgi:hypothetical protein
MQFSVNKTQENGSLVHVTCIMTIYWCTWPNLCGRCWLNTTFNRCINPCISEAWPHVIFLSSSTLRTPGKVNDVKMWKWCNLILYSSFTMFSKHRLRSSSSSRVAAGSSVSQQKGPLWRGLISHWGKFSVVCFRTSSPDSFWSGLIFVLYCI